MVKHTIRCYKVLPKPYQPQSMRARRRVLNSRRVLKPKLKGIWTIEYNKDIMHYSIGLAKYLDECFGAIAVPNFNRLST